jgi:peptide/nickel transport system permease protein
MAVAEAFQPTVSRRFGQSRALVGRANWANVAAASLFLVVTAVALAAPLLAPHSPLTPVGIPETSPTHGGFLLGSDSVGRDLLSRVLYGIRASWFAALGVVALGVLIGGLLGLVAGTLGGWVDNILMRITDGFLALPAPIVAIAVVAALGPSLAHTLIAVSIVWWPFYARIVRGEVRTLAARLDIGNLVLTLAGLSFLGLGQSAPAPELGADTARNLSYLLYDWWIPVMPGIAVALLALAANIAGDGIRNLISHR